jgi:hypothetical protein
MTGKAQAGQNVVPFPIEAVKFAKARRAYWDELERFERLEYEGKKPRLNKRILAAYHEARGICFD